MQARITRRHPDAQRPTHDGMIWPNARHAMTDQASIVERMTQDAATMLAHRDMDDTITFGDFRRFGWTKIQIDQYGMEALSTAEHQRQRLAA